VEIRSFLAFELPREIRDVVSQVSADVRKSAMDVRWVRPERIHLTLVFLGYMKAEDLASLAEIAGKVCRRFAPFRVAVKGVGFFGSKRYPRVLWIRLNGDSRQMSYFRDALQEKLVPFGIKAETRPFRPHLTLGRFRKGARPGTNLDEFLENYQDLTSPAGILGELVLFRSDLRPDGAVYTKINGWPLLGGQ
jgi:2'-5' RNA ligase